MFESPHQQLHALASSDLMFTVLNKKPLSYRDLPKDADLEDIADALFISTTCQRVDAAASLSELVSTLDHGSQLFVMSKVLEYGVRYGSQAILTELIERVPNTVSLLDMVTTQDNRVLNVAALFGSLETLQFLVMKAGINVAEAPYHGLLHFAAKSGNLEMAKWLVAYDTNILSAAAPDGSTVLHFAASYGSLRVVKWLVDEAHVDIKAVNSTGVTALECAASVDLLCWLLGKLEKPLTAAEYQGILRYAAKTGRIDIVQWLIETGRASVTMRGGSSGGTVLHNAAGSNYIEMVKWLVEKACADVNALDASGATPLHAAAYGGASVELLEWLVTHGANPCAVNAQGCSVLMYALWSRHKQQQLPAVQYLISAGADVTITTKRGAYLLQFVSTCDEHGVFGCLVRAFAEQDPPGAATLIARLPMDKAAAAVQILANALVAEKKAHCAYKANEEQRKRDVQQLLVYVACQATASQQLKRQRSVV